MCGAFGAFGFGTYAGRRPGWPGGFVDGPRWYCAAHRADGEAAHAARRAAPPAGADTKQGGLL